MIRIGPYSIDLHGVRVMRGGLVYRMTRTQILLLAELALHPGRCLSHEHLYQAMGARRTTTDTGSLRVYVYRLRLLLPHIEIASCRGYGYLARALPGFPTPKETR